MLLWKRILQVPRAYYSDVVWVSWFKSQATPLFVPQIIQSNIKSFPHHYAIMNIPKLMENNRNSTKYKTPEHDNDPSWYKLCVNLYYRKRSTREIMCLRVDALIACLPFLYKWCNVVIQMYKPTTKQIWIAIKILLVEWYPDLQLFMYVCQPQMTI